jgi:hypothetical protein
MTVELVDPNHQYAAPAGAHLCAGYVRRGTHVEIADAIG